MSDTRFVSNPVNLDIQRSKFDRSFGHKTSFNAGQLVPVFVDEVLPGDTFDVSTACIVRMGTPIAPVMDNAYLDITYFFVPNRLVWEHWEQFNGQNDTTFWTQTIDYNVPNAVKDVAIARSFDDLASYMGIPAAYTGADSSGVPCSVLPLRAYVLIYNEWYRDQNTQAPILVSKGDTDINKLLSFSLLQANKYHDYFTSCLPAPQKGPSVLLPLGDLAPVMTGADHMTVAEGEALPSIRLAVGSSAGGTGTYPLFTDVLSDGSGSVVINDSTAVASGDETHAPINLWADLSEATSATINQLRLAFQIQKLLERDARGGTRYVEMLKAHFGVTSPDSRLQRPEYLGGQRINVAMDQVLSTTAPQSEDAEATIGTTGAYSRTGASGKGFVKSFVEHGYVIGLATIRTDQTYSQGLARFWTRSQRFDFYYPVLANIGEQPVNKSEIYLGSDPVVNNQVFGYQEAWADYRFKPSYCTGYMNPSVTGGLNYWTYGLSLANAPVLNDDFMKQTDAEVNRTLAAGSTTHQFIADFWFTFYAKRPMPVYSVPGLIDHH